MDVRFIDYLIIGIYFAFVIGIGYHLKRQMVTSEDFFLAGHRIPTWVTGLAFLSANLGAIEVMGMAASAAQYGVVTAHFYWVGAIPAMVFLSLFMMPFYYGSKVRSVPEYLKKRFNEPTRAFNALSFAIMTILMSGINLYAMAKVFQVLLKWDMNVSIFLAAIVVLLYVFLGGLTSSIYNEVIQFFLIIFGLLPLTILGLLRLGGTTGISEGITNMGMLHLWQDLGTDTNTLGVDWIGLLGGLGFVLSFGYWCTDFLVIQRALAAQDVRSAQRTPIIAAFPKVLFPLITVVPGLLALVIIPGLGEDIPYDMAIPLMMGVMYPNGMLGLGLTALLASFMSGMAGNVTAFNTVWTYDIYQSYVAPGKSDKHYLQVGRMATAGGILVSILAAYLVMNFPTIMDYMQLIFSFFNAPLFATFALGMFWVRTTPTGAFIGLVAGTLAAVGHFFMSEAAKIAPDLLPGYLAPMGPVLEACKPFLTYKTVMAGNFWRAIYGWSVCFIITIVVSLFTKQKRRRDLVGLVWGLSKKPVSPLVKERWYVNPIHLSIILLVVTLVLNIIFW
ncbi:MAG: sodium:solute symporter family protein [Candidatus Obscuribacterales bacterium]|nr:sodium:solute symporter family protein [Candidatus Obscuribacterales bacterium]